MIDSEASEGSHADDIVEVPSYEAPMPPSKKAFLPWHRPRKQYVRDKQWGREIGRLIADTPPTGGVLKYLGLPGVDLLDLRHFHASVCEEHNVNLRFLGFVIGAHSQSKTQTELNVSLDEVRRMSRIDSMSHVMGDNFALAANQSSLAFKKTCELGPYDVVNLDLCDGFNSQAPGTLNDSYYDAVSSLFTVQCRSMNPWLLLLTTRADKESINDEVLGRLVGKYASNLKTCSAFREASKAHFDIDDHTALDLAMKSSGSLLPVYLTGLCKWFVGLALEHKPPFLVEIRSVYGYRVKKDADNEDLVSIAIRFTPTFHPAGDPLGLTSHPTPPLDEGALATKALNRVAKRVDADKQLAKDADLQARMVNASMKLLADARYDISSYEAWLSSDSVAGFH